MQLSDKVAIVTGGASGLGAAISRVLVERGARIVIVDIKEEEGEALVNELGADRVRFLSGDVALMETAQRAVEEAVAAFGGLTSLVNNAHAARQKPFMEQLPQDWQLSFGTGFWATAHFMHASYEQLRKNGGSVVNFGSGAGLNGMRNQSSYAAAKEAIRGLSRVLANEWGDDDIRVNVVCPKALTPGVANWQEHFPEQYEESAKAAAIGRFGDPQTDVAPVVAFLLSDDSQYMTGQTLMADGGSVMLR